MGCDTICDLPDFLLTLILLNLSTKDSVKTSILSTRWRNLWSSVPGLDLDTYHFPCREVLVRFTDRFMEFNHMLCLTNLKIRHDQYYYIDDTYGDRLMEFVSTVIDRGIQHLDVTMNICDINEFMGQNIYKCNTLVSLKLVNVGLKNPEFVVSLPCLKIMKLSKGCYGKDGPSIVEKLISGCPVLEDLQLITPFAILNERVVLFLRVRSQTLKRCYLRFASNWEYTDFTVEIDAPRLDYLSLTDSQSDRIVVKNLSSLLMIKFNLKYDNPLQPEDLRKHDILYDFLTRISSVKHMIIYRSTLEVLYCYSKLGPIPKFNNLYHLQADFFGSSLTAFLESCLNLKSLTLLVFYYSKELRQIDFTNVPQCLISTLEYVEIKVMKDETEMKLVNYFLENSAVLKKLTLNFNDTSITKQEAESYKKLLTSTKLSHTCEVIID